MDTIECRFCGKIISATATDCDGCGGGTPYGLVVDPDRAGIVSLDMSYPEFKQRYEYRMVQIPPSITVKQAIGNEAAYYLQRIVNDQANQGWEFIRVDTIGVHTPPGCLAGLFGGQALTRNYYVVTFRREKILPTSEA